MQQVSESDTQPEGAAGRSGAGAGRPDRGLAALLSFAVDETAATPEATLGSSPCPSSSPWAGLGEGPAHGKASFEGEPGQQQGGEDQSAKEEEEEDREGGGSGCEGEHVGDQQGQEQEEGQSQDGRGPVDSGTAAAGIAQPDHLTGAPPSGAAVEAQHEVKTRSA